MSRLAFTLAGITSLFALIGCALFTPGSTPTAPPAEPQEPPLDELWRYGPDGQGALLFTAQGIGFRTSPKADFVAVTYLADEQGGNPERLAFLTQQGEVAYEVNTRLLNPVYGLAPVGWSSDGSQFWAQMVAGPSPAAFLRLTAGSWQVRIYDVAPQSLSLDHDLNLDTGLLAFSNYPVMFDADAPARLVADQTPITLWVLNLETRELRIIAESIARPFDPRWLDIRTLEYNHPEEEGRVFVVLE
jgi:hypothetical protein